MLNYINIGNRKVSCQYENIHHSELEYYALNPRIYSIVRKGGRQPTQEEIEETLSKMPHVFSKLKKEIIQFGGIVEPVYVKNGKTKIVLEGNSRLAAFRLLSKDDPVKWANIRCCLLKDITDAEIRQLLGMFHIHGKAAWNPYEQAGFLYRSFNDGVSKSVLAEELTLSSIEVGKLIEIYEFLYTRNIESGHFSYYDQYLRSKKIKKIREDNKDFDKLIIDKVNSGEIPEARALRDDLPKICEKGGNVLKNFIKGKLPFEDAVNASGTADYRERVKKLNGVYSYFLNTEDEILQLTGEPKNVCGQVIKKIEQKCKSISRKLRGP